MYGNTFIKFNISLIFYSQAVCHVVAKLCVVLWPLWLINPKWQIKLQLPHGTISSNLKFL